MKLLLIALAKPLLGLTAGTVFMYTPRFELEPVIPAQRNNIELKQLKAEIQRVEAKPVPVEELRIEEQPVIPKTLPEKP